MISLPQAEKRPIRADRVAARAFSDEIVIIDPQTHWVRMFNETGSRIWELLDGEHTLSAITDRLCSEYAVEKAQAEVSVRTFVNALIERELAAWQEEGSHSEQ
ncbi:MAG: PqqD family protein [Caldilineales bacterium]|nr:PqqD family protein [Caldilineales bacterium]